MIIATVVAGFLSIRGVMPFMAICGNSMEPEFKAGDLIMIKEVRCGGENEVSAR